MTRLTRVGPPDKSDRPKKKRGWFARFTRRVTLAAAFFSPGAYRVAEAEAKLEEPGREDPWHGLPEADLPDAQREAAADRLRRYH